MWVVAGVLLGAVVVACLIGFHAGPHAHVVAGAVGLVAAAWLLVMVATGNTQPLLYALLTADVTVSAAVGATAWRALKHGAPVDPAMDLTARGVEGAMGVAVGDLDPAGVVRVKGEEWSAESVNGPVRAGHPVQVLDVQGIRLRVWGEEPPDEEART